MSSTIPLVTKQLFNGQIDLEHWWHRCLLVVFFALLAILYSIIAVSNRKDTSKAWNATANFAKFFYASFLKPHSKDGTHVGQQAALESFYRAQVRCKEKSPLAPEGKTSSQVNVSALQSVRNVKHISERCMKLRAFPLQTQLQCLLSSAFPFSRKENPLQG